MVEEQRFAAAMQGLEPSRPVLALFDLNVPAGARRR
jgi:hypothetical protein